MPRAGIIKRSLLALSCVAGLPGCVEADQAAMEPGVVVAARPVDQAGEDMGAAAVAGLVVGTAIGAGFGGRGAGQVFAAAAGAVAGAAIGTAAESASQPATGIAYAVRLSDDRVVTVVEHRSAAEPVFGVGAAVMIQTRGRRQHVVAASPDANRP